MIFEVSELLYRSLRAKIEVADADEQSHKAGL